MRLLRSSVLLAAGLMAAAAGLAAPPSLRSGAGGDAALYDWMKAHSKPIRSVEAVPDDDFTDLAVFDPLARRARVIGFGESDHGVHDHPQLRNRLFKYLVERHGFRVLMVESGILESRLVDRFIQGDPAITLEAALSKGITHGMGPWEETRDILLWMRERNESHPSRKLRFVGPDLPVKGDAPALALEALLPYLRGVDAGLAAEAEALLPLARKASAITDQIASILEAMHQAGKVPSPDIDPDLLDGFGSIGYDQLTDPEKTRLREGLESISTSMRRRRARCLEAGSLDDYRWNSHLPEVALQMVRNLESRRAHPKIPFFEKNVAYLKKAGLYDRLKVGDYGCDLSDPRAAQEYFLGRESREKALAENVLWAEKTYGKALAFAHNSHLIKDALDVDFGGVRLGRLRSKGEGRFISDQLGRGYAVIFATADRYVDRATGEDLTRVHDQDLVPTSACHGCVEKGFLDVADPAPALFLDLTRAKGDIRALLRGDREHRHQLGFQKFSPIRGYDALVFIRRMRLGYRLP